jgi:hypothetical protein
MGCLRGCLLGGTDDPTCKGILSATNDTLSLFRFYFFFFRSKGMHGTLVISGRKGNDLGVGDSTTKAYYRDGSCIFFPDESFR